MALPATDSFTASNGTALATYNASWTINNGNFNIQSNAAAPNSSFSECGAHWNADTFNNDQYAQGTLVAPGGGAIGVACRLAASAQTYYGFYVDSGSGMLFKNVAGTWTQIGANITKPANGSVLKITASSTTITAYDDGVSVRTGTDSAIASGSAGITGFDASSTSQVDNWEGGNLGGGGGTTVKTLAATGVGG